MAESSNVFLFFDGDGMSLVVCLLLEPAVDVSDVTADLASSCERDPEDFSFRPIRFHAGSRGR